MDRLLDLCGDLLLLNGALFVCIFWIVIWIATVIEVSDNIRERNLRVREESGQDGSLGE